MTRRVLAACAEFIENLGNSSGMVGRNLTLHHAVDVVGVFDAASDTGRPVGGIVVVTAIPYLGASLFPTSSGFNPTLTITTVASYVAVAMLFPSSPERALP